MSDLGPSVADIAQARNQKLQHEAEARGQQTQLEVEADTAQEVAEELKAAHLAALHIKDILPEPIQDTTQTQAFPHGSAAMQPSTTPSHGPTITEKVQAGSSDLYNKAKDTAAAAGTTIKETVAPSHPTTTTSSSTTPSTAAHQQGPTLTQKVQAAQAQLYSKAANTASAAGEAIKGTIASADQGTTTKLRDATAAVGEKAVAALSGTADGGVGLATQAGGLLTQAKETVKGALGLAPEAEGSPATAYEGAVFSSDDPEYKDAGAAKQQQTSAATESRTPALTLGELKGSSLAGAPAGSDDTTTPTTSATTTGGQDKDSGLLEKPRQPVIFSPKEPTGGSLGAGSVGVAAGDPAGGANIVAAAKTAGKGIMESLGFGGTAGAPAGPPPDHPDPRTQDVAVGDFKGLKEALAATRDTPTSSSAAGTGASSGSDAALQSAEQMDTASNSAGSTDAAAGPDPAALKQGYEQMKDSAQQSYKDVKSSAQQKLDSATQAASEAVGGVDASGGTAATGGAGGGIFAGLASIMTDIATKVNLASNSEELMAGGLVPDDAAGPAAAAGPTAQQPAPEAAAAADAAADKAAAAKDAAAGAVGDSGRSIGEAASDAAAAAKEKASDTAAAAKDAVSGGAAAAQDMASEAAAATKDAASGAAASAQGQASGAAERVQVGGGGGGVGPAAGRVMAGLAAAAEAVVHAMEVEGLGGSGLGFHGGVQHSTRPAAAAAAAGGSGGGSAAGEEGAAGASYNNGTQQVAQHVAQHVAQSQAVYGSLSSPDMCLHSSSDTAAHTPGDAGSAPGSLVASLKLDIEQVKQQQQQQAMAVYATAGRDAAVEESGKPAGAAGAEAAARNHVGSSADVARDTEQAAASTRVGSVAAAVRGAGQSLVQGAKEGLVGAYDAAAGAAASAADTIKHTAAQATGSADSSSSSSSSAGQPAPSGGDSIGDGFGHGSGSSSSPSGGGYAGGERSSLGQAWEDLKHGGAKAPRAVSSAGETAAPHDVTSNVERSKHLGDAQQAKIYDAEVYKVSPGSQAHPLSDQEQKRAAAGAVAGAKHQVTGAVPHDKPESSNVTPNQPNRFAGDKGINTGFGTGSAAGWHTDSVKRATHHFVNTSSSSAGDVGASVLGQPPAGSSAAEGGVRGWVRSLTAVWDNIGRAAAVGPTGKDVPKDFDNPSQDVMVDPVRGPVKIQGQSPGNKVMMRPADQVPTGGSASDPHKVAHKVERLGKAAVDSLTTSSEEAAADPTNLKGKSSDNKPDGTEYFLKHEAAEAIEGLKETPQKVAGALGTAAEIGGGVMQHVGEKVGDAAHMLAHPGARTAGNIARQERAQAGVARVAAGGGAPGDGPSEGAPRIHNMNVGAGGAGDMQVLEEQCLAAIESPADKRETLGDKVIGPLVSDMKDETRAKELADSWKEYKAEQQQSGGSGSGPTPGSSPAAMSSSADPSGSKTPPATGAVDTTRASADTSSAGAAEHHQAKHHTHFWQRHHKDSSSLADDAKDAAQSATDSVAYAAGKVTGKVEGAAEAVRDKVEGAAAGVAGAARDTADEARSTAAASGDVAKMEVQSGVESAAHGAGRAAGAVSRSLEEGKQQAAAAGEAAGNAAGGLLPSVGGAAKSLLGGLLGPFEREAAFEEHTAVVSGTPPKPEHVGVEQMSGRDATNLNASRAVGRDATEHSNRSVGDAVAAKIKEARGAAPPAGDAVEVSRLQAGIDDAAKAAGLAAGHLESSAEVVAHKVAAAQEAVKEQLAAATENIEVPPVEIPSSTEEILRQRQLQA